MPSTDSRDLEVPLQKFPRSQASGLTSTRCDTKFALPILSTPWRIRHAYPLQPLEPWETFNKPKRWASVSYNSH